MEFRFIEIRDVPGKVEIDGIEIDCQIVSTCDRVRRGAVQTRADGISAYLERRLS